MKKNMLFMFLLSFVVVTISAGDDVRTPQEDDSLWFNGCRVPADEAEVQNEEVSSDEENFDEENIRKEIETMIEEQCVIS